MMTFRHNAILKHILYTILLLSNFNTGFAQAVRTSGNITITFNSTEKLDGALKKLEKVAGTTFAFDPKATANLSVKSRTFTKAALADVLYFLLHEHDYAYENRNGSILIFKTVPKPAVRHQQPGRVSGSIVDDKGGALPGASIRIVETVEVVQSNVDGSYNISLKPGTYSLELTYISYQTQRITGVVISEGKNTTLNVSLKTDAKGLKEVVVTSGYKQASAAGLYAQQKNAAGITDGISAEQIARTPDNNMGQVLKRVSGLSTVDNRYIVVRGLTERYNQGMIDGVVLPSTDMNRRNFSFDVIPAEMVSNVVVNKTATPDVSAEFSGGQVSVNTLDIPLDNFTVFSVGTGFNSNTLGKEFIQAGKRGKYDFLGFDDGHRKLPDGIQSWPRGGSDPPPAFAGPQSQLFSPDVFKLYNSTGGMNQNYRLSAGRVYTFKENQKWGFVAGLSLRNNQETNDFLSVRNMNVYSNYPEPRYALIDTAFGRRNGKIYKYNSTSGAQFNIGMQGETYKIGFKNIYSQTFNNTHYTSIGSRQFVGELNEERDKTNLQDPEVIRVLQHKLDGEHLLGPGGLKLTWLLARSTVRQETKDRTKFNYRLTATKGGVEYFQDPNVITPGSNENDYDYRLFTDTRETDYNWKINLSQPFNFLGDKSLIKAGYSGTRKKRSLSATRLDIVSNDAKFNFFSRPYEEVMAPENIGTGPNQAYYAPDRTNGLQYAGKAMLHAGYLMLDQHFIEKIRLVYGLRAEQYKLKNTQASRFNEGSLRPVTGEGNTNFLPSVNFTYSITPKMNFRASFAKTIIRPDFRETSYFSFYDPYLDANIVGADIFSTRIKNTDLRYEWYPSAGEILSVSGFYKSFDKPIELVADQDGTGGSAKTSQYRFQNQKSALNYGLEIEVRKSLGFMADKEWLRNLTLFGNASVVKSSINTLAYTGVDNKTVVETKEQRALYGQSPYIINGGISYTALDYGLTVSYNRSGPRTYTINTNPGLTEYENGRALLDVQLFGRFLKKKMEAKLNIGNLLNTASVFFINSNGYKNVVGEDRYERTNGKDTYEKEFDDVRYRIKYGVTSNLSVSYKF